jgi:excisionase family DNA binding protein
LTLGVIECHKAPTGCSPGVRSANGEQQTVVIQMCADAGVAFLVSESREVMNVRQASQYLGISPDTLYRYITEGEIPAFKLGNRWKLRKTILDRWMERKMSQATARRR